MSRKERFDLLKRAKETLAGKHDDDEISQLRAAIEYLMDWMENHDSGICEDD